MVSTEAEAGRPEMVAPEDEAGRSEVVAQENEAEDQASRTELVTQEGRRRPNLVAIDSNVVAVIVVIAMCC